MKGKNNGSGIIEVVVGLAIISVGIFSILRTYNYYIKFAIAHRYDVQLALLAEEGIEAVKLLRDTGWATKITPLSSGTNYSLAYATSSWASTTTIKYIDGRFNRTFILSDVYRDSNDRIASSGTLDPNTKKVIVSVFARNILATTTKSISTYITNIFGN
ncbi:MAG: hypothetical protein Q7S19_00590 [bacterium]|nr:hypothetical protein [bacterium]